ncbi:MAG: DUF6879 family protein [Actinopolymorphaceae bacterium]
MKADLNTLFATFDRSAFRLETLDGYTVPSEDAAFAAFKAGEPMPERTIDTNPWLQIVHHATQAGKHMSRVHVISRPHTDYIRYELDAYAANVAAGEDIRIIERSWGAHSLSSSPDFWLFDDTTVAVMQYDDEGRFLGAVDDSDRLDIYRARVEVARACSVDYGDYMTGAAAVG